MEKSSYDIQKVYSAIKTIDGYFYVKNKDGSSIQFVNTEINKYCHYENGLSNGHCINYFQMASSGVIHLLINLKKYGLDDDKLADYAILWLSYKLNKKILNKMTDLKQFYTQYIEKNNYYNNKINVNDNSMTYKAIIDKKKDLIYMDNNEISKFNDLFSILFYLYYFIKNNKLDCTTNLSLAKNFVQNFEKLNKNSNITGNPSYSKLLSTLSNDYNNLINNYDKIKSCNFPSISQVNLPNISGKDSGTDLGKDSGKDSGTNSGTDSGTNSGTDSGTNSGTDSGTNSGTDSGTNSETDSGTNSETDSVDIPVKGSGPILGQTPEGTSL
ncbi:hypothetical protein YYE_04575, partial [Plasmodium vinckei vinckei]